MAFGFGMKHRAAGFGRDVRGMAAIEFALIVPLMLTLFFGTIEVADGIAVDRKLTLAARTLSDLISQGKQAANADIDNAFKMSAAILTPYPATPLQQRVTAIWIDGNGNATVVWSESSNMDKLAPNTVVSVPSGLLVNNTELILAEVAYKYKPAVGYFMNDGIMLTDSTYTRPRQSLKVDRVTS
jgi:Flp pilus assembly protein TadG